MTPLPTESRMSGNDDDAAGNIMDPSGEEPGTANPLEAMVRG